MRAAASGYVRRAPETSLLYAVIAAEVETFLAGKRLEREIPWFVEKC